MSEAVRDRMPERISEDMSDAFAILGSECYPDLNQRRGWGGEDNSDEIYTEYTDLIRPSALDFITVMIWCQK